jgi:hypothetical protein
MIQETLENSDWLLPDISDCYKTPNSKWYKKRERIVTDYYQTTSVTVIEQLTVNDTRNVREQWLIITREHQCLL